MWAPAAATPRQGADSLRLKEVIDGAMKKMDSPQQLTPGLAKL
jgi:hypothetical protein